jgi:ribosomal protein S18
MNPLNSSKPTQQQNPKEQALNLMKQQGFNIPEGKENDPNYLINYVMQSGKYPQSRLTMAQQMMQKMFRR